MANRLEQRVRPRANADHHAFAVEDFCFDRYSSVADPVDGVSPDELRLREGLGAESVDVLEVLALQGLDDGRRDLRRVRVDFANCAMRASATVTTVARRPCL